MEPATGRARTREAPDVRRVQILDAANRVFLEEGLPSATMDDVARAAGIAKGTIYLYFPSKAALVQGLQARMVGRVTARARRLDATVGFAAQLDRFVSGVVDDLVDYAELQHLVLHEAPRHGVLDEVHGLVTRFIERGKGSGELSVSDPAIAAWFLVEGLLGVLGEATHDPRPGKRALREALSQGSRRLLGVADAPSVAARLTSSQ
jgi:AcrR family transcriptional regulator